MPGFAVSHSRKNTERPKSERHTRERNVERKRGHVSRAPCIIISPSHCATRTIRKHARLHPRHCETHRELTYTIYRAYTAGKRERARCFLLNKNTHCTVSSCAGVAAVTCGATFPFVAVVASTVVHRRPAAHMFSREQWTAFAAAERHIHEAVRRYGTRVEHAGAMMTRQRKRRVEGESRNRHSRSRVQASTRERR